MKLLKPLLKIAIAFIIVGTVGSCGSSDQGGTTGIDQFEQVHDLLQDHVSNNQIAGASALVLQDGEVIYRDHIGWMDVEEQKSISDNTLFRIASMTKAVTSVAVMQLNEQNQLSLSDPVSQYIPSFSDPQVIAGWDSTQANTILPVTVPAERSITIHDLMTHIAGLSYGFMNAGNYAELYKEKGISDGLMQTDATTAQNIDQLADVPLLFQPGSQWQYSMAHDVLGRVVEVVSGKSLDQYFQDHIFSPLQMNDTQFFISGDDINRLATLYTIDSDQKIIPTATEPVQAGNLVYSSDFHYEGPQKYYSGGAGLISSIEDYGRFLQMLLDNGEWNGTKLLEPTSVELMSQNQIGELTISPFTGHGDKFGYGFGVLSEQGPVDDVASVGTYSWGGIFNTYYWVDPQEEIVGIIMTQLFPYDHLTLRKDFKDTVYDVVRK